ncbi:MAG: hypothetical protein ABII12_16960 [Planctomycetota bacterium]
MAIRRHIPLNPCDYLYYAHHEMLRERTGGGNIAYMMIDVAGDIEPARIRRALARALAAHPVLLAKLRISRLTGWPYWKLPRDVRLTAARASDQGHVYEDLRGAANWRERLDGLCAERYTPQWDLDAGLLVRLEQYALPGDRTRFCVRWPHLLMDAEGAQWFLTEIGRNDDPDAGDALCRPLAPPDPLAPDDGIIDPLVGRSLRKRIRLLRRGFSLQDDLKGLSIRPMARDERAALGSFGVLHRHWDADQVRAMRACAKQVTPPGPVLYARYLAACVIRAQHRLYMEHNLDTDAYLITLPMRVTLQDALGSPLARRPMPGNYLVSPTLCGLREHADDKQVLGEDILRQLNAYHEQQGDLAQWAMAWGASFMRAGIYGFVAFKLSTGFDRLTSGFSCYGEIAPPFRSIGGADVVNCWGGGPLATPPGWNPVFNKFRDRMNFSLTWNRPAISDGLAGQYAALIEEEVFEAT